MCEQYDAPWSVNSDGTVDIGIRHNLGSSKKKLPHMLEKVGDSINNNNDDKTIPKTVKRIQTQHEINIIIVTIAAAGVAWMLFH